MPLKRLQESGKNSKIKGLSNRYVSVAQLDRAQASDAWCRRFESAMVCQKNPSRETWIFSFVSAGYNIILLHGANII